jgi:hypothetical protein
LAEVFAGACVIRQMTGNRSCILLTSRSEGAARILPLNNSPEPIGCPAEQSNRRERSETRALHARDQPGIIATSENSSDHVHSATPDIKHEVAAEDDIGSGLRARCRSA